MQKLTPNTHALLQRLMSQDVVDNLQNISVRLNRTLINNNDIPADPPLPSLADIEKVLDNYITAINHYCEQPIETLSIERQKALRAQIYETDRQLQPILDTLQETISYNKAIYNRSTISAFMWAIGIITFLVYFIALCMVIMVNPNDPCPPPTDDDSVSHRHCIEPAEDQAFVIMAIASPIILGIECFTVTYTGIYLNNHSVKQLGNDITVHSMHSDFTSLRAMTEVLCPRAYTYTKRAPATHFPMNEDIPADERTPLLSQCRAAFYHSTIDIEPARETLALVSPQEDEAAIDTDEEENQSPPCVISLEDAW